MKSLWKTRLRALAKKQGIDTVEELGEKAGVAPSSLSRVFSGRVPFTDAMAEKIAEPLKVRPWEVKPDYGLGKLPDAERDIIMAYRRVPPENQRRIRLLTVSFLDDDDGTSTAA